jgi:hypothetical protein
MGLVDWTGFNKNEKSSNGAKFLKLEAGKSYMIRPVHKPHVFYKYFIEKPSGGSSQALTDSPDDCIIKKKYGEQAKMRFAVNVIDRADGKLKVMEGPISILKQFAEWANMTGKDPGSKDGGEFAIRVDCPGGVKKNTKYMLGFINYTPFTADEKTMIKDSMYDLAAIYKPTPQNEIEAKLYGSEEEGADKDADKNAVKSSSAQASGKNFQPSDDFDF